MDPCIKIAIMKEQGKKEHAARRNFAKRWGNPSDTALKKFYNPNVMDAQLKEQLKLQDLCPYAHTSQGDSYFMSRDMYRSVDTCRCGRPRGRAHMLPCVQKRIEQAYAATTPEQRQQTMPPTANSQVGWQQQYKAQYHRQWEPSMKYISPVHTMPGYRIGATPYNAIKIG